MELSLGSFGSREKFAYSMFLSLNKTPLTMLPVQKTNKHKIAGIKLRSYLLYA